MREIIEPIQTRIVNPSAPDNPHACGGRKINHKFTTLTKERVKSHWSYNDPLIEGVLTVEICRICSATRRSFVVY